MSDVNAEAPAAEPQVPPPAKPAVKRRAGGYAALVAAGILLSRIAGLIRTRAITHFLGTSLAADAFAVAQKVPNVMQNLLGEGVLSASFIPVYARLIAKGDEKLAGRVAGVFVSMLTAVVTAVVLLGIVFARPLIKLTAWGLEGPVLELSVTLTRIIFPGVGILVVSAWCLGVLNTHRQFFLSYIAPVLWNVAQIAVLVVLGAKLANRQLSIALAWGLVVGCVLQLVVQLPFVFKHAKHLSFGLERGLEPVKTIFRQLGPAVGGRGVVQISSYVDQFIASFLPQGALARLLYAQTIYMLPVSVFGMSVAAAELPQMASQTGSEEEVHRNLRQRLDRGIRQIAFFIIPTTLAFIVLGRLIVAALYQSGEFDSAQTLLLWYMLIGSSVGLLVATMGRLYQSTLYALHDTKTPFRIAMMRVGVGAALALAFTFPFRGFFPAVIDALRLPRPRVVGGDAALAIIGITFASAVASWIEYSLLRRAVGKRIGYGAPKALHFTKLWLAAVAAGIVSDVFDVILGARIARHLPLPHVVEFILAAGVFGAVYFGIGWVLGVEEVRTTLGRFFKKLR